jgi:hypothetical protein
MRRMDGLMPARREQEEIFVGFSLKQQITHPFVTCDFHR